jgi:heavy metal sensor kinase
VKFSRLPIRWQLTLWFTACFSLLLLVAGVALVVGLHLLLYTSFDKQLRDQAISTASLVRQEDQTLTLPNGASATAGDESFVRLMRADGQTVQAAPNGSVPLDPSAVAAALSGRTVINTELVRPGTRIRLVTTPVVVNGQVVGVLQVGASRTWIDDALHDLLGPIALISPVVLLIAFGGGYLMARRALEPVVTITQLAAAIDSRELDRRLDLDLPDDELGQLVATFNQMLARIAAAFDQQRRFADDAAHELRTPLSLLQSQIDLALARPRTAAAYEDALAAMRLDLARLTKVVGMLLTLARSDSGRLSLEFTPFDLASTVELVGEQYAESATAAGVLLRVETQPTPLVGDEDLLVQVLVNLLDNALAHTPAGGTISLCCRPDGEEVRLWVTDTGSGIAAGHLPRVFDRFYRVDAGRGRAQGGTGLGLSICRAIVTAHSGSITLVSTPGSGTRALITLPAGPPKPTPAHDARPTLPAAHG